MAEQTARPVNVEEMATVAHHVLVDAEASHMAMVVAEAIAKHLATPVPEIAPGTAGTATVRGVEGVRVMRVEPSSHDTHGWVSPRVPTPDGLGFNWIHSDSQVTDFVPDLDRAAVTAEMERLEIALGKAERERDEATYRLGMRTTERDHMKQRWEDAKAEVEMMTERIDAVLNLADQWKAAQKENAAAMERHELLPAKTPDADDFRYAATGCLEVPPVEPDAAPEPRPAFVLPEREAVIRALMAVQNATQGGFGVLSFDRAVEAVLALLAEHAVTEDRMVWAVVQEFQVPDNVKNAHAAWARLTGKAAG